MSGGGFIVIGPHSRETGVSWAPGDLAACRKMCAERGSGFLVIKAEDIHDPNPYIYNYSDDPKGEHS